LIENLFPGHLITKNHFHLNKKGVKEILGHENLDRLKDLKSSG
jgi:hypothetical protein